VCAYREQNPGAGQQNIANDFSLLWGKPPISRRCIEDVINENVFTFRYPCFNAKFVVA
jgi:hypothetical protein